MIKLRDYQQDAINNIKNTFKNEYRQYIEMPTGSGKTITFLSYIKENHKNCLIIVPSCQLLNQVYDTCLLFYHKSEISRKGNRFNEKKNKIHICVINSIRGDYLKKLCNHNFDITVIDEAHHSQANTYKRFINNKEKIYKQHLILGLTATPDRVDGKLLKEIFFTCSFKLTVDYLIGIKQLCDIEGYTVKTGIDISDVDSHNKDFSLNHLYNKLCTDSRNNMIVDLCINEMNDRKTLIFCINVDHSKEINRLLNNKGIISKHIDGSMNSSTRNST